MPLSDAAPAVSRSDCLDREGVSAAKMFFVGLALYFALQILLRVFISNSADLDESDQLVLTQKLAWGYGPQPPLYSWLQILFFRVFGLGIFSLALLKNLFLFCTYLFTYLSASLITRSRACGIAAAASLLFLPQLAWESQRDLTHSVLASTMAAGTLFAFLKLSQKPGWGRYSLFGIWTGLGLISKYNYALLLVGLIAAAATLRQWRTVVLSRRMLLAGALALLIFCPNAIWILRHRHLAFQTASKFAVRESESWLKAVATGLGSLLRSTGTFLGPLALICAGVYWRPRSGPSQGGAGREWPTEGARLLTQMLLIIYGLIALSVCIGRVTDIRDRWLQPILVCAPVLALGLLRRRFDAGRLRVTLWCAAVVMTLVSLCIPGRILMAERLRLTQPLNRPYDALAAQMKSSLTGVGAVVTDTELLAGNLRLQIRGKTFTSPEFAALFDISGRGLALAWDAGDDAPPGKLRHPARQWPPPERLRQYAAGIGAKLDPAQARYFSATFKYHKRRRMRVGMIVLKRAADAILTGPVSARSGGGA